MAPKVPRHVAMDLIKFAKKVDVLAYAFNQKHKSAVAFVEQMSSPKFHKLNTNYEVNFAWHQEPLPSVVRAEFTNGFTWEICADDKSLADLRHEFFQQAAIVEEGADDGEEPAAKAPAGKKK